MRYRRLAMNMATLASFVLLPAAVVRASAQNLAMQGRAPRFMFVEKP